MATTLTKAEQLAYGRRGTITEEPVARVFDVVNDRGVRYTVVLNARPGVDICTCPAGSNGRGCYHVDAAELVATRPGHFKAGA